MLLYSSLAVMWVKHSVPGLVRGGAAWQSFGWPLEADDIVVFG